MSPPRSLSFTNTHTNAVHHTACLVRVRVNIKAVSRCNHNACCRLASRDLAWFLQWKPTSVSWFVSVNNRSFLCTRLIVRHPPTTASNLMVVFIFAMFFSCSQPTIDNVLCLTDDVDCTHYILHLTRIHCVSQFDLVFCKAIRLLTL